MLSLESDTELGRGSRGSIRSPPIKGYRKHSEDHKLQGIG
jgi:hypothetical protein